MLTRIVLVTAEADVVNEQLVSANYRNTAHSVVYSSDSAHIERNIIIDLDSV